MPKSGKPGGWMVFAAYFSMGQRHDYRDALKAIKAPVLIVHGERDLQSEEESRSYTHALQSARFITIQNTTHFPFNEEPEMFGKVVGEFLTKY
ncbi:MAG: alpha/beta hydrolase [Acidobacteria bacterium]|nr:alpha/beta hydrolase [Acidobacteriota bacterium]